MTLRHYIYIEEGILALSILASLGMMLHTKNVYNAFTKTSKPVSLSNGKIEFLFQQEKGDEESAQDEEGLHPSCARRNPARNFCQCGGVVGGIFGVRDENEQDADTAQSVEARETAVVCDLVGKLQVH